MRVGRFCLLLLLLAVPCCHRTQTTGAQAAVVPQDGSITIKIVNNNKLDVILYVVHDSYRDRMGSATASATTTFELRLRLLGAGRDFQLLADPVGSREPVRSETLHPLDGQVITWTLETDFARSTVTVF